MLCRRFHNVKCYDFFIRAARKSENAAFSFLFTPFILKLWIFVLSKVMKEKTSHCPTEQNSRTNQSGTVYFDPSLQRECSEVKNQNVRVCSWEQKKFYLRMDVKDVRIHGLFK